MGMEYIYAALTLYELKQPITEENMEKIFEALNVEPDKAMIKHLVESLKEVNIEEALKTPVQMAAPAAAPPAPAEEKKEEEKKEEKKEEEEEAMAGLSALFG